MNVDRILLLMTTVTVLSGCADPAGESSGTYPQRPIKVIVPFSAGGGSDQFARLLQREIERQELLPVPLVIVNVPGAGGTIGSRRVKNARPDGYTFLLLHDGILTAKYSDSGAVNYGPEAFEPVAGTGDVGLVIAASEKSGYETLGQLMEEAAETPDRIRFSANLGAPVHFTGLMLEAAAGSESETRFRFVQHGGGAKRLAALLGGHADVSAFSVAEYLQYREGGIRALAYCGEQRHPVVDAPTAKEQGYDVVSRNMQFWWAPKGTDPNRVQYFAGVLETILSSEAIRERLKQLQIEPVFLTGEELEAEIARRAERIASVSQRPVLPLPDLPVFVFSCVAVLGLLVVAQSLKDTAPDSVEGKIGESSPAATNSAALSTVSTAVLTLIYVLLLQSGWVGFRPATFLFVLFTGCVISGRLRDHWRSILMTAVLMSVVLHLVFTHIFIIDLP